MPSPETRYAKGDGVHVAHQRFGKGPVKVVFVPGFVSDIDHDWVHPTMAALSSEQLIISESPS